MNNTSNLSRLQNHNIDPQQIPTISLPEDASGNPEAREADSYQEELKSILKGKYSSSQERSKAFIAAARKNSAVEKKFKELETLRDKYPNCATIISHSTWKQLVKERELGMTKPQLEEEISLEEFRAIMNAAIDGVAITIGNEAGCAQGVFGSCGTVSYNSDVDIAIMGQELTPADANLYTSARNETHTAIFDGHSGPQLDTEAYIPHPANYDTINSLSSNQEARARFTTCEKANVILQYYVSLSAHPNEYLEAKQSYLNNISDTEHREGMTKLFEQVEALMTYINLEIYKEILLENGYDPTIISQKTDQEITEMAHHTTDQATSGYKMAYKNARENVTTQMRAQMGEKIQKLENKIHTLAKLSENISGNDPQSQRSHLAELDDLYNKRNEMFSVMNILQDEGTNSQAEGKATLFQENGQMHTQAKQKAIKDLTVQDSHQSGVVKFLIDKGGGTVLDHLYKNKSRRASLPTGFEKPDANTLSIASDEEAAQRLHTFNEAMNELDDTNPPKDQNKIAIKALARSKHAKYATRTTSNSYKALDTIIQDLKTQKKSVPRTVISLKLKAEKLMGKSENLLRCMRRDSIGGEATQNFLETTLAPEFKTKEGTSFDPIILQSKIRKVINLFEPGGIHHGKLLEKYEKMNIMVYEMIQLALIDAKEVMEKEVHDPDTHIKTLHLLPTNPRIREILEARAGYSMETEEYAHLKHLHEEALFFTCERMSLNNVEKAKEFNSEVIKLNHQRENLFIHYGWIPKVTLKHAQNLDLLSILKNA